MPTIKAVFCFMPACFQNHCLVCLSLCCDNYGTKPDDCFRPKTIHHLYLLLLLYGQHQSQRDRKPCILDVRPKTSFYISASVNHTPYYSMTPCFQLASAMAFSVYASVENMAYYYQTVASTDHVPADTTVISTNIY